MVWYPFGPVVCQAVRCVRVRRPFLGGTLRGLPELHADLLSRYACPLERAVFLLWRSTKQVGVHVVVPRTRYQIYCKKQAGRFSQSEKKRIDRETCLLLYVVSEKKMKLIHAN